MMDVEQALAALTLEEKAGLCSGRDFWHTKAVQRLDIPSVLMCDGPHGLRKQVGEGDHLGIQQSIPAVCYPSAAALASSFDRALLKRLGETLGDACQAEGVAMLLGPGLNMKRSPLCGRNFEYFSEDPYLAGELGAAYITGLQSRGVAACCKHYAANNQETRRMASDSQVDARTLHEIYLPAFEAAVKQAKVRAVMCAYNKVNGTYASEHQALLTDILRDTWGFEGFVVTDWGAVKDRVKGLRAGLDLEMPGGPGAQDARIVAAVRDGTLAERVLDDAVRRMLTFVSQSRRQQRPDTCIDHQAHHERAVQMETECAVLLRNEGALLPLEKGMQVALIGAFAVSPRYQGSGSSRVNAGNPPGAMDAAAGLSVTHARGYDADSGQIDDALVAEAVKAARAAQAAVLFVGLPDRFESEGVDRKTLALPANQTHLIEAVAAAQPSAVVVLHGGAPVEMPWIENVRAVLNLYLGGEGVGEAAVRLLYGDANPSGKLAETYPIKLSDTPAYLNFPGEEGIVPYREGIYIGYRYFDKKEMPVLFPFGHGLSYTKFTYENVRLSRVQMRDEDTLTVSCDVRNDGAREGKEAVQLYVRDIESTVGRPIRELKDFAKVSLAPGETKTITFQLTKRAFAYYEPRLGDWHVQSGHFGIDIGASSRDIRLTAQVLVEGTARLPMAYTRESTIGEAMQSPAGYRALAALITPASDTDALGEGNREAVQSGAMDLPLSALTTFGRMDEAQLTVLLAEINANTAEDET